MTLNKSQVLSPVEGLPSATRCTVFFDGACPVCSREIAAYRRLRGGDAIKWVDASRCAPTQLCEGLDRADALNRLHVQRPDGALATGAAAFVEIWSHLPAFKWVARLCVNRCVLALLDFFYSCFLVMRRVWRKPIKLSVSRPYALKAPDA